jgi:predicted transposase YdaD
MAAVMFDTHKFVRKLQEAGFEEKQAEGISEAQDSADIATKRDLKELELKIESRFEQLKGEVNLVKWMLGAILGLAIANFAKQFL